MVTTAKVRPDGQVTLPATVSREAGFEPGDVVVFKATDRGTVEVQALRDLTLEEALERYRIEGPIDEAADREAWQDEAAKDVFGSRRG